MTISPSTFDVAEWLLNTSHQALTDCGREPISRAYVAAGEIAWDDCCGMLVVAPERVYRSDEFPTEAANRELCFGGIIAIQYVVLLVRCAPTVDDRGRAPSAADLQAAYTNLLGDAAVIYNAIVGPMPDYWMRATPAQTFVGAQGGCIAVETRVVIGIEQDKFGICCTNPVPHDPGDPVCRIAAQFVSFEPCDDLTSTNVQDAICELATTVAAGSTVVPFTVNGGTIGGTQPTFDGPPLFTGHYVRTGDLVYFDIQVNFDNITSFGTGQYFLDLPFAAAFPKMVREGCLHDISAGKQYSIGGHVAAGSQQLALVYIGSNGHDEEFDHNSPVNLQTVDNFHVSGTYIAV